MKKTIAILMASASAAFSATEVNLNWTGNVADISGETFTSGKATFVLTLDIDAIQAWANEDNKANEKLGYLSGTNSQNTTTEIGFSLWTNNEDTSSIRPWRYNESYGAQPSGGHNYQGTTSTLPFPDTINGESYTYATLVFTVETNNNNSKATGYLFLINDKLEMVDQLTSSIKLTIGSTYMKNMPYTSFTINTDYVNPDYVALYNGIVDNPLEAAKAVLPVPEPTTATLSLLALAGLAARRRRA